MTNHTRNMVLFKKKNKLLLGKMPPDVVGAGRGSRCTSKKKRKTPEKVQTDIVLVSSDIYLLLKRKKKFCTKMSAVFTKERKRSVKNSKNI